MFCPKKARNRHWGKWAGGGQSVSQADGMMNQWGLRWAGGQAGVVVADRLSFEPYLFRFNERKSKKGRITLINDRLFTVTGSKRKQCGRNKSLRWENIHSL